MIEDVRNKDTKDLTNFELGEKIRLIQIEVSQFNKKLLSLSRETYILYGKREKRIEYCSKLKQNLNKR